MTVPQNNWVFLGSQVLTTTATGFSVPMPPTSAPPRNGAFPYYDLLMVRWHVSMNTNDMLYMVHDLNLLGSNYNSRIFRYSSGTTTPAQTNSVNAGWIPLFSSATSGGWFGVINICNIPRPTTGERTIEYCTMSVNNAGSPPVIQIGQGSTVYSSPMTNIVLQTVGTNLINAGSSMVVFGSNIA
jgi:hypothetical protein